MPRMTQEQLDEFYRRTVKAFSPRSSPIVEPTPWDATLATPQVQEKGPDRIHICIVSVRKRLIDPDNLAVKWHIDCLRYLRIIPGDEPEKITLDVSQRKAFKGEQERTEITIEYPPSNENENDQSNPEL